MTKLLATSALLFALLTAGLAPSNAATPPPTVMAFDLGWAPSAHVPWDKLTQADLFALQTKKGTGLDKSELSGVNVGQWVAAAHAHQVQAMIAIGGSSDQHWQYACNATNRKAFISNLVRYAVSHGFDGIDIDIEDGLWAKQGPPSAAQTRCVRAISAAAHAATSRAGKPLWVSEDVITNWQGSWLAPYVAALDQVNLMTYGDDLKTLASDVQATHDQGVPYAKMVVGIDVDDYAEPSGGCGQFAQFASQHSLMGAFVWDAQSDDTKAGNACVNALAGG